MVNIQPKSNSAQAPSKSAKPPKSKTCPECVKESRQPVMQKAKSLRVRVDPEVVEGGANGPFERKGLSKVLVKLLRRRTAVKVESLEGEGLSASVLYAPGCDEISDDAKTSPFVETELVSGNPKRHESSLVYQDSPFEIRVAGMLVKSFDKSLPWHSGNELLMYSVQTDPETTGDTNQSLPFIHFNHDRDGHQYTSRPNTYIPIPASKSYVLSSPGTKEGQKKKVQTLKKQRSVPPEMGDSTDEGCDTNDVVSDVSMSANSPTASSSKKDGSGDTQQKKVQPLRKNGVNVQFKIIELDRQSKVVRESIKGIDELGGHMATFASAAPFLGVLSPALSLAAAVGKGALDSYAKPDKVISIDMDFLLADRKRVEAGTAPCGEYLRYGYYFFLEEPFEGKLYASVKTPKNVQLLLKKHSDNRVAKDSDDDGCKGRRRVRPRQFFPLTEVSYLVVRVCEPTFPNRRDRQPIQMAHAKELETIFKEAQSVDAGAKTE